MKITLGTRTIKTVEIYFKKTNNKIMHKILPQKAKSVDESIKSYELTLEPEATSYGRTILANNQYIGDVWCYAINLDYTPNAMISYCVFETKYWNMGIATKAVRLFIKEIIAKFNLKTISAFTFADNLSSIRVLEKNNFILLEEFTEDGVDSKYFQFKRK